MNQFAKPTLNITSIISTAKSAFWETYGSFSVLNEWADSIVIMVTTTSGKDLFIKVWPDVDTDIYVLKKLEWLDLKVPKFLWQEVYSQNEVKYPLLVMSGCEWALLKDIPFGQKYLYIGPILEEFSKFRSINSPGRSGYALDVKSGKDWTWKNFLLRNLNGENPDFNWQIVLAHKNIKEGLLKKSLEEAKQKVVQLDNNLKLSLLHTDINEANLLVQDGQLTWVIDWSDAKYGDFLFDFARFRMNIRQNMNIKALEAYLRSLNLSWKEKEREKTYYLLNVLEYTNWYVLYGWDDKVALQMNLLEEFFK